MSDTAVASTATNPLDELRRHKEMFDNSWNLAMVIAAAVVVTSWYFGLANVDIGPVIWTLAGVAFIQFILASASPTVRSPARLRMQALISQLLGTVMVGSAWHLFGGLQQPLFPLLIVPPLLTGSLLFGFWQQGAASLAVVAVLISGVILSPDTSAFVEQRYGISIAFAHVLPAWMPRSRMAFADVNTSPSYDLLLMSTAAAVVLALSNTAHAVAGLCARSAERVRWLEGEMLRVQDLTKQIVTHAPSAEAMVLSHNGRIVNASERFIRDFDLADSAGEFLLDSISFAYPDVIKRLLQSGGEEIQAATLHGRDIVLRIRSEIIGSGTTQVAAINLERCDDICWRGEVDALDEPVFAINARGDVVFMNRCALEVFGNNAEGDTAAGLFESAGVRWWDIAPLEAARRTLERGGHRYLASIRRRRIAVSVGEVSFVHLHEIGLVHAVATA